MIRPPPSSILFPYTTLFRSRRSWRPPTSATCDCATKVTKKRISSSGPRRSEEHTSELQSHSDLVCRLLLEKKKLVQEDNARIDKAVAGAHGPTADVATRGDA